MGIIKICSIIVVCGMLSMLLKEQKNNMHSLISITAVILVATIVVKNIDPVLDLSKKYSLLSSDIIQILIKAVGISYLTEFSSLICKDMGENSLATVLDLCGKVEILLVGMPIFENIMDICLNLIN